MSFLPTMPLHVHLRNPQARPQSLIFCSSLVMSPSGGPPYESLDASGLLTPYGGGSISTYVD
jgi:hypothetical protein